MTSGGPDLFVVCKSCQSEVSPYITECPYCGARLRKRAPKLDRQGRVQETRRRARRTGRRRPSLGRLRVGEMAGIRADTGRPVATFACVIAGMVLIVLWRANLFDVGDVALLGRPQGDWWRVVTAPFAYTNTGYAFAALAGIALFGTLVERRHGHVATAALIVAGGAGGMALAAVVEEPLVALGGNGIALALLGAWSVPDLARLHDRAEPEGDMLGLAVCATVLLLLPAVVYEAAWLAGVGGLVIGLLAGVPLAARDRA